MGGEVSVAFQTDKPLAAYGPLAAAAERHGFDAVSVYNDLLYQPAWPALFEIARATRRVRLGPSGVNPFTCHPVNIAGYLALLDEASKGRAYLGLVRGAWLDFLGLEPPRAVLALREAFECVRHLLRGSREPYAGRVFRLGGDSLRWKVPRAEVPFLLGTWGPRAIHACLHEIVEVKVGGTASARVVSAIRAVIRGAAAQAERDPERVGVVVGCATVVDRDGARARDLARRTVALYLPVIAELDPALDVEPERLTRISEAVAAHDVDRAARNVTDEVLAKLAFAGTPDEVAAHAAALFAAGAHRIEFGAPHGVDEAEGLRLLGEDVVPALRGTPAR